MSEHNVAQTDPDSEWAEPSELDTAGGDIDVFIIIIVQDVRLVSLNMNIDRKREA